MNKTIIGLAIVVVLIIIGGKFAYVQSVKTAANRGESKGTIVTITGKSILETVSGSEGSTSTTREYVVFTNKGAYLINDDFDELSNYGQLQVNSSYEIFTIPSLDFQYQGSIVTFRQL